MRKMSGGREKLQLHTMNRGEFPWAWKRIIKGILAHFHSPRSVSFCHPQRLQTRSPARSNVVTYLMPMPGARVSFFPTLLELCPFWGNSIFISKISKCSEEAQFKMVASRLTWVFNFKFELIEMKWNEKSVPPSHESHFKCSAAACGDGYHAGQFRLGHFHHHREFSAGLSAVQGAHRTDLNGARAVREGLAGWGLGYCLPEFYLQRDSPHLLLH